MRVEVDCLFIRYVKLTCRSVVWKGWRRRRGQTSNTWKTLSSTTCSARTRPRETTCLRPSGPYWPFPMPKFNGFETTTLHGGVRVRPLPPQVRGEAKNNFSFDSNFGPTARLEIPFPIKWVASWHQIARSKNEVNFSGFFFTFLSNEFLPQNLFIDEAEFVFGPSLIYRQMWYECLDEQLFLVLSPQ